MRAPLIVFCTVLVVSAAIALAYLAKPREAITSTPSAYTGLTVPLPVPAHGTACADEILYDTDSQIARFGASGHGGPAPALEILAQGNTAGPYRNGYASSARLPGGWTGTREFDVPLRQPHTAVFGTFCVRNLGDRQVDLVGSQDGRAFARPTVRVNGDISPTELQLRLLERGRHSILSRLGAVTTHAATLKPFGAWWMWVLALALVGLAPLALLGSVRAALLADGERVGAGPPLAWPAWLRRVRDIPGWALLAGFGALAVLWFLYWDLNTHVFQNDEDQYVYLSRWLLRNLPGGLWDFATYGRGLQRLEVWLLAVPAAITHNPWTFGVARLLNAAAFVSTAIPVYLLARGNGLSQRWAALPALLSAVVPWAVVTTAFLTENVAYPAFAWIVYAIWRSATRPGTGSDILALAAIFVGGLSRSALLALAPVLPLTIILTHLRCGAGGLRPLLRSHALLWGLIVAGGLLMLSGIGPFGGLTSRVAGGYGTHFGFDVWGLVEKSGRFFSRVVIGTGFLPAAVGLPWLALTLARSRDAAAFALALASVLSALVLFYTLNTAGYDERYILYLAPLVLLPAGIALARGELSPAGTAIASVLLAALLVRVPWNGNQGTFAFFVWPVETFYSHVLGFKLAKVLPGGEQDALKVVGVGLGLLGVLLGAALRLRPARLDARAGAALVAAVGLAIVAQTQYSFSKHVNGVGSKAGPSLKARSFADTTVPSGAKIGEWAAGVGQDPGFYGVWREVQFYNQRLDSVWSLGGVTVIVPPGDDFTNGLTIDGDTGTVHSPAPLPPYMVVPTQANGPHLRGDVLQAPSYIPVALVRRAQPPAIAWNASGFTPDGAVADAKKGAQVIVYGGGATCASVDLSAPFNAPGSWTLRTQAGDARSGRLDIAKTATAEVPVAASGRTELTLRGSAHLLNVRLGCHNG